MCATGLAVILGFRVWSLMNPAIPPFHALMALAPVFCAAMFLFENLYPGIGMGSGGAHSPRVPGDHPGLPDADSRYVPSPKTGHGQTPAADLFLRGPSLLCWLLRRVGFAGARSAVVTGGACRQ